jgi:hypothetical protein
MDTMTVSVEQRFAYEDGPAIDGWFNVIRDGRFVGCVYQCGDDWRTNANHQRHATFPTRNAAIEELFRQKGIV